MTSIEHLKVRLREVDDLQSAASLLRWDLQTYMPAGGAPARGRQTATLSRLAHERFTDAEIGRLLDACDRDDLSDDDRALVRVTRRLFEQAIRVPASLVAEWNEHAAVTYQAWTAARPANDFEAVRPLLEKTLELSRRQANCFPGYDSIADPLIDTMDYGMKASTVRALFGQLREKLVPLVRAITSREPADDRCLKRRVAEADQLAFGLEVIRSYGYDFERGRQDKTVHPFMTKFSLDDVRITTRVDPDDISDALFGTLHECGHALYEQNIKSEFEGTPLANGTSNGVHESQSRLWENVVGRSRPFWEHFYPKLVAALPQFADVSLDAFYRAINKVQRSLIRVDADEVTYNLHVMLRFDLEVDMLEGRIAVKDLPRVWRERFEDDLGVAVPNDRDGALQDVHWYDGPIGGAFQGYTIGNILSAQFFDAAVAAHPEIPREIASGRFATLRDWLVANVYQHGAKYTAAELVERATGRPMAIDSFVGYLWRKFQPLYSLDARESPMFGA
jgi:carboxypeptidase Taq